MTSLLHDTETFHFVIYSPAVVVGIFLHNVKTWFW